MRSRRTSPHQLQRLVFQTAGIKGLPQLRLDGLENVDQTGAARIVNHVGVTVPLGGAQVQNLGVLLGINPDALEFFGRFFSRRALNGVMTRVGKSLVGIPSKYSTCCAIPIRPYRCLRPWVINSVASSRPTGDAKYALASSATNQPNLPGRRFGPV